VCLSRDDLMFVIRYVCLDIGGSDPERMAAPRVEEYIQELFGGSTTVSVSISYDVVHIHYLNFLILFQLSPEVSCICKVPFSETVLDCCF